MVGYGRGLHGALFPISRKQTRPRRHLPTATLPPSDLIVRKPLTRVNGSARLWPRNTSPCPNLPKLSSHRPGCAGPSACGRSWKISAAPRPEPPRSRPRSLEEPAGCDRRVGAAGHPAAPLTEPDLWATHPALRFGISGVKEQSLTRGRLRWSGEAQVVVPKAKEPFVEPPVSVGQIHACHIASGPNRPTTPSRCRG